MRAFEKAVELKRKTVLSPEALYDIRGAEYTYPMLYRFGAMEVTEEDAEKMYVKRSLIK